MPAAHSYKTYKRRWYVLALVTVLSASNSQNWCSFSSVANLAAEYYNVSVDQINTFSITYCVCCFVTGVFSMWFNDYVGLNKGIWLGAWLNALGITIEFISTLTVAQDMRFTLTIVGQIFAGIAQMNLFVPTKVAELWFASNERTLATSLIAMGNPAGIMLGYGLTPLFVTKPGHIPLMITISAVIAVIFAITSCWFRSSTPPTPPSESAWHKTQEPFHKAIIELAKNKAYFYLLMFGGSMVGLSGALCSLLEEILRPRGYTNTFSGLCIVLMTSFGIVGGTLSGVLADKTKAFTSIAKITGSLSCALLPVLYVIMGFPGLEYEIATLSAIGGLFALMAYTVLLELTVECTYPKVPEATSTGIVYIFGQLHATIYVLLAQTFAKKIVIEGETALDMKRSSLIIAGLVTLFCVIFVALFKTEHKRTEGEKASNIEAVMIAASTPSLNEANFYPSPYGTIGS